jgi:hypothetical protein
MNTYILSPHRENRTKKMSAKMIFHFSRSSFI